MMAAIEMNANSLPLPAQTLPWAAKRGDSCEALTGSSSLKAEQ
jgi:hypothetical protein